MKTIKILFVEDAEIIMKISKRLIEDLGYHPDCAITAEDALQLFKKNDYDLVLTDIGLPGMSGIELSAQIREYERQHKKKESIIYAITAFHLEDVRAACASSGINCVFNKPLQEKVLAQMIQNSYLNAFNQSFKQLVTT